MAKYIVIHPTRAVIFPDGSFVRQGGEVDLTASTKKKVQKLLDGGYIAAPDSAEAKAAIKAAKATDEEAE